MFDRLLKRIADDLRWIADHISPSQEKPVKYFPPGPIGEIRPINIKGKTTYYWYYTKDGKRVKKYLSRDKQKAEEKREEMSGWLLDN